MKKASELFKGFVDTIPLGISVSIYGVVYGVLGGKAGLSVFDVLAMSLFIFAGASQIAAVQMISQGSSPVSIIFTVFVINLRHYLLAASISPKLKDVPARMKLLNAFFMTDESYAVSYTYFQKNKPSAVYFLGSGLNIYLFWGVAGVVGYLFGNVIPPQLNYVFDFAFVAAFLGMLVPMVKDIPVAVTVTVSAVISVIGSLYLPGKWYILIAGIGASAVGYASSLAGAGRKSEVSEYREVTDNE